MRKLGVILVLSAMMLVVLCSVAVEAVEAEELGGDTGSTVYTCPELCVHHPDPHQHLTGGIVTPNGDPFWDEGD